MDTKGNSFKEWDANKNKHNEPNSHDRYSPEPPQNKQF